MAKGNYGRGFLSLVNRARVVNDRTRNEVARAKAKYEYLKAELSRPIKSPPRASSPKSYGPMPKVPKVPKVKKTAKKRKSKKDDDDWWGF